MGDEETYYEPPLPSQDDDDFLYELPLPPPPPPSPPSPPPAPDEDDDRPLFPRSKRRRREEEDDDDEEEEDEDQDEEDGGEAASAASAASDVSSIDRLSDAEALEELRRRYPDTALELDKRGSSVSQEDALKVLKQIRRCGNRGFLGPIFDAIKKQQDAAAAAAPPPPLASSNVAAPPVIPHPPSDRERDIHARVLMSDPDQRGKYMFSTGLDDQAQSRHAEHEQLFETRVKRVFDDDRDIDESANDEPSECMDGIFAKESNAVALRAIAAAEAEQMLTSCWLCGTRDMEGGHEQAAGSSSGVDPASRPEDYKYANIANVVISYMKRSNEYDTCVLSAIYYYNHIYRACEGNCYMLRPSEIQRHFFSGECIVEPRFTQLVLIRSLRRTHRLVERGTRLRNALTMEEKADTNQVKALCDLAKALGSVYMWKTKDMACYAPHMQIDAPQVNQVLGPRDIVRTSRKERR